jgi:hypothetical protein
VRHAMPLFACHGVPSGVGIALRYESNVRLLGIDSPGLGLSSPHPIYNLMKVLWSGGMTLRCGRTGAGCISFCRQDGVTVERHLAFP